MSRKFSDEQLADYMFGEADDELIQEIESAMQIQPELAEEIRDLTTVCQSLSHADPGKGLEDIPSKDILDLAGLASLLAVTEEEIILNLSQIPHFRISGHIRFSKSAIDRFISSQSAKKPVERTKVIDFNQAARRQVI